MKSTQSSSVRMPFNSWGRVGNVNNTRKPRSLLQVQMPTKSRVLFMTFAACLLLFADKLLLDFLPNAFYEIYEFLSVLEDGGFFFYSVGFTSAYLCLSANRMMSSRAKTEGKTGSQRCRQNMTNLRRGSTSAALRRTLHSLPTGHSGQVKTSTPTTKIEQLAPAKNEHTQPHAHLTNALNQALSQGDAARALDILAKLESAAFESDAAIHNQIMRAFAKSDDFEGAEKTLDRMRARKLEPNEWSYSILMNMCAKSADVQGVEHWILRMQKAGVTATWMSYSIAIHARARRGEEAEAQAWMQKMVEAGYEPQCSNYNSMIHACSVKRNVKRAEEWLEHMRSKGIEPTVMTYTALVDASSKCVDVKNAEKYMQQMLDLNIKPNVVSFSSMLDACARAGDLGRAERWYSKLVAQEVKPNAFIFSALINACAKANDPPAACDWLARAEASGATLDAVVYGCVINACGKAGDSKMAMTVFQRMREHGIKSHIIVYGALARPFAYQGDWQEVERIAQEMEESDGIEMNDYFLYTMLLAYSRAKPRRGDKAEQAFRNAVSKGLKVNDRILKALSNAVGRARAAQLADLAQGRKAHRTNDAP